MTDAETEIDQDLLDLQERWSPSWKIWRARHMYDPVPRGSYCASRMDDSAGITPFLMSKTAQALHIALEAQLVAVQTGATSAPEPPVWP